MDVLTVKAWVNRGLALLGFASGFTPTKVDDNIIAFLKVAVENDQVMEVLTALVNLLAEKKVADKHAVITMDDVVAVMKKRGHVA